MKKIYLILTLAFLAACSPKKNDVKLQNFSSEAVVNNLGIPSCPQDTMAKTGSIYDISATSYNFESQVKALLSAGVNPNLFGFISSQPTATNGVTFAGVIKIDSDGKIIPTQSNLTITVKDLYAALGYELPYKISFTGSQISGYINLKTGKANIDLADSAGSVKFEGSVNAQSFSGNISFINSKNVLGGAGLSGNLGQFFIKSCGILQ